MKIIVLSDSHRDFHVLYDTFNRHIDANLFIFLGDGMEELEDMESIFFQKEIWSVSGNCDYFSSKDTLGLKTAEGVRVLFTHGHLWGVKNGLEKLRQQAEGVQANLVLFGHTHLPFYQVIDGIHYFNPGSISAPRDGHPPTYGQIILQDGQVVSCQHMEV